MFQFSGSSQAAVDYNSTIIDALELSEKKWVLAVQLPGVSRHSRQCWMLAATGWVLLSSAQRPSAQLASDPIPSGSSGVGAPNGARTVRDLADMLKNHLSRALS